MERDERSFQTESDVSIASSQYDGGKDINDSKYKPTIPIEFKFKQPELQQRFMKLIKTQKMVLRERLKIGDLIYVLTTQLKLPRFIKLNLSFQLEGMKFPISFPKSKRMYKVSKHLEQLSKAREQIAHDTANRDSSSVEQVIYVIIEAEKRKGYENEKIDQTECCDQQ